MADEAPIEDTTSTSVYAAPVSADALVATETWGLVPADQVVVVLEGGADIEVVAGSLDARVVGEIPSIALFQLQTGGATATDLDEALATAAGVDGVELAFPNVQVVPLDACDPLADPAYEGSLGDPYRQIGLHGGWDVLRAAGIRPADVRVGVVDSRVTTANGELDGPAAVVPLEAGDVTTDADPGSHGTGVTQVIAATADNGGVAGVASVLGDAMTVSVTDIYRGDARPDVPAEEADPDDPTVYVTDGVAHTVNALVAIQRQVDAGATIINASFGPIRPDPAFASLAAAYHRYLARLAEEHPEVIVVAAAGNEGTALDGHNYGIQGHRLSNLLTVGAIDASGADASFTNPATGDGEVSLMAPGVDVPVSTDGGAAVTSSGTSFSTPMVAGAAALLRAVDPSLTAAEIKQVLVDTAQARAGGPPVLRVDEAVLRVVNAERERASQPLLNLDDVARLVDVDVATTRVSAVAYTVTATLDATAAEGTGVGITEDGPGSVEGPTTKGLGAPGSVVFPYAFPSVPGTASITVTRLDNQSCRTVTLTTTGYDGRYEGAFTFMDQASYSVVIEIVDGVISGSATSKVQSQQYGGLVCPVTTTIEPTGTIDEDGVVHDGSMHNTTTLACGLPGDGTYESDVGFSAAFRDGGLAGQIDADPMLGGPYPFTLALVP